MAGEAFATSITNVISTVNIENKKESGTTGGLVGYFGGSDLAAMSNCGVNADITGTNYVGGIIGASWDGTQFYTIKNASTWAMRKAQPIVQALVQLSDAVRQMIATTTVRLPLQNVYYSTVNSAVTKVGSWKIATAEAAAQISKVERVSASQFTDGSLEYRSIISGIVNASLYALKL